MSQDYNYGRGVSSSTSRQVSRRDELRVTGELPTVDHSPSRSYHQQGSYSTPGSARGSPVVRRSTRGGARSSSPLGYAGETSASQHAPVPHSMSTGSFAPGYYDDLGSPAMDHLDRRGAGGGSVGGPAGSSGGHHRSRSATRSTGISRYGTDPHDREFMPIREPRERSLDRGMDMSHHRRERSLERGYFEDDLYGPPRDPHAMTRSTRHSPNPDLTMKHSTGTSRDSYFVELQHQNSEFQKELGQLKKELELTNQKLGSSMHSIKTFWSPELKKERALRKEESAKYSLINDQLKLLNSENQKQAMLVRQLEEELRLRSMRNPSAELQNQMEALYAENDHLTREITILRETIKELELRIDTQKQTLQARDESIKKLLEMLQSKGVGKEQERHMFQHMQALAQKQIEELRTEVTRRDQELLAMSAKMKTLEEQHADYQRHIAVLKESLCAKEEHYNMLQADVEELRQRLEEKNRLIEKKTQTAVQATQERNRLNNELNELRDHMDIKDRKINVLQRKIENLEDLLKEKDNQVDMARARLTAIHAHHCTSEGALSSLEEAISDKEKQIQQLREQRDRAEQEKNEERDLHEREIAEYKMKLHTLESEVEKLQVRLERAMAEKDKLEAKLESSQSELGKSKAELDKVQGDAGKSFVEWDTAKQKLTKLELENDRLRTENDRLRHDVDRGTTSFRNPTSSFGRVTTDSQELERMQEKLDKAQSELRRSQAELRMNQAEYERAHVEVEQLQEKVEKSQGEIYRLKAKLENAQSEKDNLQDEYDRAQMDLLDANHKLASIGNGGEELTHLRKQVEEQRRQLEEQRRQLEEQRHQLEDYRKQMESQRQQLSKGTPADPAQKKMIDDKAKALEKMEIEMKKRKERLDHMEEQLKQKMVNAVPGKGPPASVQAAELQKALAEKEQLLASHQKDLDRMKEEGKRSQNELERLLQLMQMTQEEQNTKDKQIQDLQHALRAEKTKVQKLQTAGAQMADQAGPAGFLKSLF